jgi:hypothetical protein
MLLLGVLTTLWCVPGIAVHATRGAHVAVDEPQYLLSATSLAEDLDLDISDELAAQRWRTYHHAQLPEQTKRLEGGERISPHDPLLPVLLAIPMALGGWVAAKVLMALLAGALAAALLWVAEVRLGVERRRSLPAVACFTLASPLAVYATQVYPELAGALALTLGLAAALGPPSRRTAAGMAAAASALPWLSVKYAPVAAALVLVAFWRWRAERRLLAWTSAGLVASGVAFAVGHLAIYGGLTPYATGDHFAGGELTVVGSHPDYWGRSRRLLGLFVDRDWGLAAWQPAWLLVLAAVGAAARRRSLLLLPLAVGWATATWVALTMHGFWWSGRQTVVVLPVAVLLVAAWAPRRWTIAGLVLGATTWWWLVADGVRERITWVVHVQAAGAPVHRLLRPLLPDLRTPEVSDGLGYAVWLAGAVALLVVGWRSAGGDEDAGTGEGADADRALGDLHGDGAVR